MDSRLNPHLASVLPAFDIQHFDIRSVRAMDLFQPWNRFDLAAKAAYATDILNGRHRQWVREAYLDSIRAFNGFAEDDGTGKRGEESFTATFESLINSLRSGYDPALSLVPVDRSLTIIDGAHRVAAAVALGIEIKVAIMPTWQAKRYDHDWFCSRGMDRSLAAALCSELPSLHPSLHVAVLYPAAARFHEEMISHLGNLGGIVLRQRMSLTGSSAHMLVRELYWREPWLGSGKDGYAGARAKAESCCGTEGGPAEIALFFSPPGSDLRAIKERLRALSGLEKHSIHIDDGGPEALRLARTLLLPGSRHFLADGRVRSTPNFERLMGIFADAVHDQTSLRESHCLDGGAVLAALGLRDTEDLDVISSLPVLPITTPGINRRTEVSSYYGEEAEGTLSDPRNHFWHRGCRFLVPELVAAVKRKRGEGKDAEDLRLISSLSSSTRREPWRITCRALIHRMMRRARAGAPMPAKHAFRLCKKAARRAQALLQEAPDWLSRGDRTIRFKGHAVSYLRGDSLIRRIRQTGDYEPHVTIAALGLISSLSKPTILDVGSNIGLFSLALLETRRDCRIIAFDPGPTQHRLFSQTIARNNLGESIKLHNMALADADEEREFSIHSTGHCSGDGFLDTKRAGATKRIQVRCLRLDTWWSNAGRPAIDLLKIDAEGAESLILSGAKEVLKACRPRMLIEINAKNLKPYGLTPTSMRDLLDALGYRILGIDGSISPDINASSNGGDDMFIALTDSVVP